MYDVIFCNEKGHITEGCIHNIFIKKNNVLFTPPISCGLLNGIYRQHILATSANVQEKPLYWKDLVAADEIFMCNSVQGLQKVQLTTENEV